MTSNDVFDATVAHWLETEAEPPIPTDALDRALTATTGPRPRPSLLAAFGSHWIAPAAHDASAAGTGRLTLPAFRASWAVLLLLALAVAGVMALIGSRATEPPIGGGQLAYALGGDIYLADPDGGDPVQAARGDLASGSIWAPDGRYFLFHSDGAHISDPDGRVVASFDNLPGFGGYPTWSPDSTRLQAWTHNFTRISIYGIDGVLQTALPVPDGYVRFREVLGEWAPDGRAVLVRIDRASSPEPGSPETWRLPIDGSAATRIADDDPLAAFDLNVSRNGLRVAFSVREEASGRNSLFVANADGTNAEIVRTGGRTAFNPVWSPTGTRIAYLDALSDSGYGIRVVDLQSGVDRELVPGYEHDGWPDISWSPAGDKILLPIDAEQGKTSLWSVIADGSDLTLLVTGAAAGAWQPAQPPGVTIESVPSTSPSLAPAVAPPLSPSATRMQVPDTNLSFTVEIPAPWKNTGPGLIVGTGMARESSRVSVGIVGNTNTDLCGHRPRNPPIGSSVADLAHALSELPEGNAKDPESVTIDGLDAMYMSFRLTTVTCPPPGNGVFAFWEDSPNGLMWGDTASPHGLRSGDRMWIVDVDGQRVVIRASASRDMSAANADVLGDLERIVESIHFE